MKKKPTNAAINVQGTDDYRTDGKATGRSAPPSRVINRLVNPISGLLLFPTSSDF